MAINEKPVRNPVGIACLKNARGDTIFVVCDDGAVFVSENGFNWMPNPPIPGTAASVPEEKQ